LQLVLDQGAWEEVLTVDPRRRRQPPWHALGRFGRALRRPPPHAHVRHNARRKRL